MLKHIEEFKKHIAIAGLRTPKIEDVDEFLETLNKAKLPHSEIQFFDASLVATWEHLYFATLNALTAFKTKANISKSLAMETMLYASAQHQISRAMQIIGIKPSTKTMVLLIIGENADAAESVLQTVLEYTGAQTDDDVLELSEDKMEVIRKAFGITELELATIQKGRCVEKALTDLVIERMALLATQS